LRSKDGESSDTFSEAHKEFAAEYIRQIERYEQFRQFKLQKKPKIVPLLNLDMEHIEKQRQLQKAKETA
jgi:hypothetical protein